MARTTVSIAVLFALLPASLCAQSESFYNERIRQNSMDQIKTHQIYANSGRSFYASQQHERADSINRISGYFSPQGISVFNPDKIGRAIRVDQLQREKAIDHLKDSLQVQVGNLAVKQAEILGRVFTQSGELITYDKGALQQSSRELQNLANDSLRIKNYTQTGFKEDYKKYLLRPYENKSQIWSDRYQIEKTVSYYIEGNGAGWNGLNGIEKSSRIYSAEMDDSIRKIRNMEYIMEQEIVNNYFVSGFTLATSLLLAIPTGGASIPGWVSAAGILNSSISLGNNVRSQIILNEKGLEGYRSQDEATASQIIQATQLALGMVPMVYHSYQSVTGWSQNPRQDITQIKNFSNNNSLKLLGINAKTWHNSYYLSKALSTLNQISDLGGLKEKAIGKEAAYTVNGIFAFNDLLFSYVNPKISVEEPYTLMKRSRTIQQNMGRFENLATAAKAFPAVKKIFDENSSTQMVLPTLRFFTTLESKVLEINLDRHLKDGTFNFKEIKPYFNFNAFSPAQTNRYLNDPFNKFALDAVYETSLYGNQTQSDPYVTQIKSKNNVQTSFFVRTIPSWNSSNIDLSDSQTALFASLYKMNPKFNSLNRQIYESSSSEERKDSLFSVTNEELKRILRGETQFIQQLTPDNTLSISNTGKTFDPLKGKETYNFIIEADGIRIIPDRNFAPTLMPIYKTLQTPQGLAYGGEISLKNGYEYFVLPKIKNLNGNLMQPLRVLGGGIIKIGDGEPLNYSGLYTYNRWNGMNEIFSAAYDAKNGGLFLGVGVPFHLQDYVSKVGFILPTGSGILLAPTHLPEPLFSIAYQGLNQKWSSILLDQKIPFAVTHPKLQTNYLTSEQFNKKIITDSLRHYFNTVPNLIRTIDNAFKTKIPFSDQGVVTFASLAKFYEKTDPTGGGLYQLSYSFYTPQRQLFEYATRTGFHYVHHKIEDGSRIYGRTAHWNQPFYLNHWVPFSTIYKNLAEPQSDTLYTVSWEKGLSVTKYKSNNSLTLESAWRGDWKKSAIVQSNENQLWRKYERGVELANEGTNLLSNSILHKSFQDQHKLLRNVQVKNLGLAAKISKPLFQLSYAKLKEIEPSFLIMEKAKFLDKQFFNRYHLETAAALGGAESTRVLEDQLRGWNRFAYHSIVMNSLFNSRWEHNVLKDQIFRNIEESFQKLDALEFLFGNGTNDLTLFHNQWLHSPSNITYTQTQIDFANSDNILNVAIQNPLYYIALAPSAATLLSKAHHQQGIETGNLWERGLGWGGKQLIGTIPLNKLGERMISVYQKDYASRRMLVFIGVMEVWEGTKKLNKLMNWKDKIQRKIPTAEYSLFPEERKTLRYLLQ